MNINLYKSLSAEDAGIGELLTANCGSYCAVGDVVEEREMPSVLLGEKKGSCMLCLLDELCAKIGKYATESGVVLRYMYLNLEKAQFVIFKEKITCVFSARGQKQKSSDDGCSF